MSKCGVENLRVYCNIQNLLTITGYDGYDPEIGVSTMSPNVYGVDFGRYPSPTTYSFGLNLSFNRLNRIHMKVSRLKYIAMGAILGLSLYRARIFGQTQ